MWLIFRNIHFRRGCRNMFLFWCGFPLRKAQAMCFLSSPKEPKLDTIYVSYRKILIFFVRFDVARHVFRPIWFKARWRRILLHWSRWDSLPVYLELPSNRAARCSRRQDRSQGVVNWSWVLSSPKNYRWAKGLSLSRFEHFVHGTASNPD